MTLLLTDIVGSTRRAQELGDRRWRQLLDSHHAVVRRELNRFRGREFDTAGDGLSATFDGPARAVRAGCAIRDSVRPLGLDVRAASTPANANSSTEQYAASPCTRPHGSWRKRHRVRYLPPRPSATWSPGRASSSLRRAAPS